MKTSQLLFLLVLISDAFLISKNKSSFFQTSGVVIDQSSSGGDGSEVSPGAEVLDPLCVGNGLPNGGGGQYNTFHPRPNGAPILSE